MTASAWRRAVAAALLAAPLVFPSPGAAPRVWAAGPDASPDPAGADTHEVTDMLGRRLIVPRRINRVVSLAPSATEIVYALGASGSLVGVTDHCDFPDEARSKPRVGGFYNPSLEKILTLDPQLVLATSIEGGPQEVFRGATILSVPTYVLRPVDLPSVLQSIEKVGGLLGRERESALLTARMGDEADAIARRLRGRASPRVLYVLWGNPLIVPGRGILITDLIRRAGGISVSGDEPLAYPRLSFEEALARKPDVVVIAHHGQRSADRQPEVWQHLGMLPAVAAGRLHRIDGDLTHRPGPRVIAALRRLARMFHPEVEAR
jgi:iron complex transport system substrate-binding protein